MSGRWDSMVSGAQRYFASGGDHLVRDMVVKAREGFDYGTFPYAWGRRRVRDGQGLRRSPHLRRVRDTRSRAGHSYPRREGKMPVDAVEVMEHPQGIVSKTVPTADRDGQHGSERCGFARRAEGRCGRRTTHKICSLWGRFLIASFRARSSAQPFTDIRRPAGNRGSRLGCAAEYRGAARPSLGLAGRRSS
jgi:hypothetical protein